MAVSAFSGLRSSWAISRSWAAASRDRRRLFSAVLRPVFIMASVLDLRREMVVPGDYKMVNAILAAAVIAALAAGSARAGSVPPGSDPTEDARHAAVYDSCMRKAQSDPDADRKSTRLNSSH